MDGILPAWLITVISLVGSTAITTIIGLIIKVYFTKYIKKRDLEAKHQKEKEEELYKFREEQHRQERKEDTLASVSEVIKPIIVKLDALNTKLDIVEDGTLSTLRNDILTCYYKCIEKHYRNDYDYQNIHHMFESYTELHGNSYVADIMQRFDELPTREEYLIKQEIQQKSKEVKLNTKTKVKKV